MSYEPLSRVQEELERQWQCQEPNFPMIQHLAHEIKVSPLIAHILLCKGYEDAAQANQFFRSSLRHMADPNLLQDCHQAAR